MSMKYSNDIIGNRTRDLPICSAVPQPTAPPRAPPPRLIGLGEENTIERVHLEDLGADGRIILKLILN